MTCTFVNTKSDKQFFMKFVEVGFYIQKALHFVLHKVFIYKEPDPSQKARQFALRFIYKNPDTLFYAIFIEFLELAEGVGHLYIQKIAHFALHFYMQNIALCAMFLHTKSQTLCVTFYTQKNALFVTVLYLKCIV